MSVLFDTILKGGFDIGSYLLVVLFAAICGVACAIGMSVVSSPSKSFTNTLLVLPVIVATVIIIVNGQIGTGVAVMGAFSLIRFRSVPGKARDIAFIFLAMTAGIGCGAGYVGISLLFTLITVGIIVGTNYIPFKGAASYELQITIPESLRFAGEFDEVFKKYTKSARLTKTKTTNMGSLFKLVYKVDFLHGADMQEFINDLRCRNGNLEIALIDNSESIEEL
jgi:hypothetical protein